MSSPRISLQGIGDERAHHLLAPHQLEVGVVHRLGDFARRCGGGSRSRRRSATRPSRSAAARSASSGRDATAPSTMRTSTTRGAVEPGGTAAAATGKSNDAAAPQLPVRAAPPVGGRQRDRRQDLVRALGQVVHAVVGEESASGSTRWPPAETQRDRRAQRLQHRRRVGGRHGQALRARRRDPAGLRRPSSCRSRSPSATRSSGRSRCSACRGTGCRRWCPCCAGAASRPARPPATARVRLRGSARRAISVRRA